MLTALDIINIFKQDLRRFYNMRRQRSQTIEAQSYEEFLQLSQIPIIGCRHRARKGISESFLSQTLLRRSSHLSQKLLNIRKKSREFVKAAPVTTSYWDDMDFDSQTTIKAISNDNKNITSAHYGSMDAESQASDCEEQMTAEQSVNQVKIMVVGAKGVGRHTFVNNLFESNGEEEHSIRTTLDLVVKKREGENAMNIFKFWIKDASSQDFEHLVKAYYKTVGLYIFLYQVDDRRSFECLDQAIRKAQEEVKGRRFVGLLVGGVKNILSGCNREVHHQEGEELRNKYGLSNFLELNFVHGEDQERLLRALTSHELTFWN